MLWLEHCWDTRIKATWREGKNCERNLIPCTSVINHSWRSMRRRFGECKLMKFWIWFSPKREQNSLSAGIACNSPARSVLSFALSEELLGNTWIWAEAEKREWTDENFFCATLPGGIIGSFLLLNVPHFRGATFNAFSPQFDSHEADTFFANNLAIRFIKIVSMAHTNSNRLYTTLMYFFVSLWVLLRCFLSMNSGMVCEKGEDDINREVPVFVHFWSFTSFTHISSFFAYKKKCSGDSQKTFFLFPQWFSQNLIFPFLLGSPYRLQTSLHANNIHLAFGYLIVSFIFHSLRFFFLALLLQPSSIMSKKLLSLVLSEQQKKKLR